MPLVVGAVVAAVGSVFSICIGKADFHFRKRRTNLALAGASVMVRTSDTIGVICAAVPQ